MQEKNREGRHHEDDSDDANHIEESLSHSQMSNFEVLVHEVDTFKLSSKTTNADKVLIFSQFLEHIHVIEQQVIDLNAKYLICLCVLCCKSDRFFTVFLMPVNHCWY